MNTKLNGKLNYVLLIAVLVALVMTAIPVPVAASRAEAGNSAQALPPVPEWPIIGPVLQWFGVSSSPAATPVPTPGLTEYRMSSYEDLGELKEIESGERVRIIVSENDLNAMIRDRIEESIDGEAEMVFGIEPNVLSVRIYAEQSLLEEAADNLPRQIRDDLDLTGAFGMTASQCVPRISVQRLQINGWSFGLRLLAQGPINTRIRESWPSEICVERVLLMQDEAAVEGYRR